MAQVGRGPLEFVRNQLRCACCGERVSGRAAGADVVATHRGPVLVGVTVTSGAKELHACTISRPARKAG